jgi:GNAT superfamily N-acetyltransferase
MATLRIARYYQGSLLINRASWCGMEMMNDYVKYHCNKASATEIAEHLSCCDSDFIPSLSQRTRIGEYADKISVRAVRFEAWSGERLVGLVAAYCNDRENRTAFITSVSVAKAWTGRGIATMLMTKCIEYARADGMGQIGLEVDNQNAPALRVYDKFGFVVSKANGVSVMLNLNLDVCEAVTGN